MTQNGKDNKEVQESAMKRIGWLAGVVVCGALSAGAQVVEASSAVPPSAQVKDELLAGTERFAAGAKNVSEVNMDAKTMGMVTGKGSSDFAKKMDFVVVRSYEYDKAGMYQQADFDAIRKRLDDGSWSCMVRTRDKDSSTDVCARQGADHETNEMIIMTAQPKEVTFVHLKGRMPISELGHMGKMGTPTPPVPPLKER